MKPVRIGILGLGTVGSGTVEVLNRNREEIARRAGREIEIGSVAVRSLDKARPGAPEGLAIVTDPFQIVRDPAISVVVELIGGQGVARELVLEAIEQGKHVVTANKALIAVHGNEIFEAARRRGVVVAFEAAVAGGIPVIKAIREGLAGNRIQWVAGIINGTCNFILSEMRDKGRAFSDVLGEAQRLGYAEADPSFDIDGVDAAHKLCILGSIAFGIPLQFERVHIEGIRTMAAEDVANAETFGYRVKLLGMARRTLSGIELRVHPTLIPARRLIANVDGVMNAVIVNGDAVGSTLYYGAGAGAEPTASAVVADIIDVVRTLTTDPKQRVPHLAFQPGTLADLPILPISEIETAYYLRLRADDRPGVLADVTRILGDIGISIEAILQKEPAVSQSDVSIVMLTHRVRERHLDEAIARMERLASVHGSVTRLRVESLN